MKYLRLKRTTACLLALLVSLAWITAAAVAAAPDADRRGEIQITLKDRYGIVTGGAFTLWQVGEISLSDGVYRYRLTEDFQDSGLSLEKITDPALPERFWKAAVRKDLPGHTEEVDREGSVSFGDLELGVYLVVQTRRSPGYYAAPSFLVTVPFETEDGFVYRVDASPKLELEPRPSRPDPKPPTEPDTELPEPETPLTPPEVPEPPAPPEVDLPEPEVPLTPHIPQTGQLNWPVPVLAVLGVILFAWGWLLYTGKESYHEK